MHASIPPLLVPVYFDEYLVVARRCLTNCLRLQCLCSLHEASDADSCAGGLLFQQVHAQSMRQTVCAVHVWASTLTDCFVLIAPAETLVIILYIKYIFNFYTKFLF